MSNNIRSPQQEVALILDDTTKEILKYDSFQDGATQFQLNEEYISLK
jgi:hypothetical protein